LLLRYNDPRYPFDVYRRTFDLNCRACVLFRVGDPSLSIAVVAEEQYLWQNLVAGVVTGEHYDTAIGDSLRIAKSAELGYSVA
jgi:hypothetical protein